MTQPTPPDDRSRARRALDRMPALLASMPVIAFGVFLFFYLFVFAGAATLFGHPDAVSTQWQLILGNYTNVSSSVGAGLAAGASLRVLKHHRETRRMVTEIHDLLHRKHTEGM